MKPEEAKLRLEKMVSLWQDLKNEPLGPNGEKHVFHVEFGHFYNMDHFKLYEEYAVRNAHSLGMNEAEMKLLMQEWAL
jgi:ADP-dependent phosphofructokinase/glucokinase